MKKIDESLQKMMKRQDFKDMYQNMREEILSDPYIQHFLKENYLSLHSDIVNQSLMKLYEYKSQSKECQQCPSLGECKNMMKGYEPTLVVDKGTINLSYHKCPRQQQADQQNKMQSLIQSVYVPKDVLNATFQHIDLDTPTRMKAVRQAMNLVDTIETSSKKGLYIHGKFGVGKSYILGAIANELATKKISSYIVYVPEFFREMKSALGDSGKFNDKLDAVKNAPVLMLDDIGAESMSSWARDEILGTILQHRMLENLPTFFSSNFNFEELEHHLAYSQRGEEEKLKAARIMERINYLATPIALDGPNRRG
ncbi:primosomal protein DnaI [Bacillus coahuilensis m2-6]|uniref:primosomal protein DnaI n=1 Tax=Bacillus coahuilensis TaxID=408580 RepID=UPI000750540B|nr:primosomal protein DnaI [Bacillus coahuilensis]KUP06636.1 primosomal protein DnaI [Bacillus coahuilensis m2-6]